MKATPILSAAALAITCLPLIAGGEGWTHDFEAAKKQAAEEDKSLLVDFTGSDWCGWCIKLNEEVFQHDPFKEGVKDKFVLVELDYPRDKSKLDEKTIEQNERLQQEYAVRGFPTILLTDAEGKPFARTGYQEGGPEKYVEHLDTLLEARTARDKAFAKAAGMDGPEKAKALLAALEAMQLEDAMVASFYGDIVEQIKVADPGDETGFVAGIEMNRKLAEFENEVNSFAQKQDLEGALKFVNKTLDGDGFTGEPKQKIGFYKAMILAQMSRFDDASAALDDAKTAAPDSELAGRMDGLKAQLAQAKAQQEAAGEDAGGDE